VAVAVVAAGLAAGPADGRAAVSERLLGTYNRSISSAAVYRHSDLRRLRPLRFDRRTHTAVVSTLTGDPYVTGSQRLHKEVWVTGAPEVKTKCEKAMKRLKPRQLALFLRELLGLHPDTPVTHFVTFTVRRDDVFRPAVNPDPTTRWPCGDPGSPECGLIFPRGVSRSHIDWMANEMLSAWIVASPLRLDGYPWTRLGYTYDWRPGANRYGASEYVVQPGSNVDVTSVTPYEPYCGAVRR
jgi:hypothetical protein